MAAGEPLDRAIGETGSETLAGEWTLVLAASGIEHRLEATAAGWTLRVRAADAARVSAILADYEAERRLSASVETPSAAGRRWLGTSPPPSGGRWVGAVVGGLLVGVFALTGPWVRQSVWFERGAASAGLILDGEPWRAVTSLTLHADLAHVLGNALACIVLLTAVARSLGTGVGLWLVLLAGAGGNALTALAHGPGHVSVGASTSTFGALGVLGAVQIVAGRRRPASGRRAWVVGTAMLLLLALLGTAAHADVLAHVFGLVAGGTLGLMVALALRERPGPKVQRRLVLAAAAAVIGCWLLALGSAGATR